jgi:4-phytase/acid phosphatase
VIAIRATGRRWRATALVAYAVATVTTMLALPAAAQGDEVLQKMVIVSRHGVATPLVAPTVLATWAAQPWPQWSQPAGDLTPRGAQLAALMGRWYRDTMGLLGALPAAGCPAPGAVYAYADVPERTQATARALLEGFAPGCNLRHTTRGSVSLDPLFHPVEAGVCTVDPFVAQTRVLERAGGDLNRIVRDLKPQFATLQGALDCCKPALCTAFGRGEACSLAELPTAITTTAGGAGVTLVGALPIAAAAAEILLHEFADGLPPAEVGWGRISAAQLRETQRLHTEYYDLTQRVPYLARKAGSSLLAKVAAAVTSSRALGFGSVDPAVRDAKLVAYVGHDTNIWNLAGTLDVSWLQPGYQRNQTPPAGALVFEVVETPAKKLKVYTSYVAQSPEQMRNRTALTLESPPARTPLRLPGCSSTDTGYPCTIEEFAVAARNALERDCVE